MKGVNSDAETSFPSRWTCRFQRHRRPARRASRMSGTTSPPAATGFPIVGGGHRLHPGRPGRIWNTTPTSLVQEVANKGAAALGRPAPQYARQLRAGDFDHRHRASPTISAPGWGTGSTPTSPSRRAIVSRPPRDLEFDQQPQAGSKQRQGRRAACAPTSSKSASATGSRAGRICSDPETSAIPAPLSLSILDRHGRAHAGPSTGVFRPFHACARRREADLSREMPGTSPGMTMVGGNGLRNDFMT